MESTLHKKEMLALQFPYHQMQTSLSKLTKLKNLASMSIATSKGKAALNWLQTHKEQIQEILKRGSEPYYRELPYRNRSNGLASWQYDIIWNQPDYKGCIACGANRIGKSRCGGFITALMVTGQHPRYVSPANGRAWIVGLDSKAIEAICKPYFEMFMPRRYIETGKWNGKHNYWTFDSDGRHWEVWFKSVDSGRKKFQGDALDFGWVDEEPLKEGIFSEFEMRLVDRQGIWLMTATPVEGTRWLKETLDRDDVFYTMAGMKENPYIPVEEIEKVARQLPKDERDVRIEGKYIIFGGRPVFDRDILNELEKNLRPHREGVLAVA